MLPCTQQTLSMQCVLSCRGKLRRHPIKTKNMYSIDAYFNLVIITLHLGVDRFVPIY